ncbi:hypothetical protein AN218_19885 [Streptomyces nanshensis]|uniref:NlpC/P60 domain-containing protein n=2 Tax=Streptomyces nanshensis TaxID=518642 RepID=A0A1E7L167_9ACTN|nr:hypothetical protein AN218_19885 [Streptomyces nanshensis]
MRPVKRRLKRWGCLAVAFALLLFGVPLGVIAIDAVTDVKSSVTGAVAAVAGVPGRLLVAYQAAEKSLAERYPSLKGFDWSVLAGIAKVESGGTASGHKVRADGTLATPIYGPRLSGSGVGGNTTAMADTDGGRLDGDPHGERAVGPMQFLPSTWARVGQDGNGDGRKDPQNVDDAALAAAVYLTDHGKRDLSRPAQLKQAVLSYNHSSQYVQEVTGWIGHYKKTARQDPKTAVKATGKAKTVIDAAMGMLGRPYSWGGGGPDGPSSGSCCSPGGKSGAGIAGFDCSGLTQYAYARGGIRLPRIASQQAGVGRRVPAADGISALRPGDLVFFGFMPGIDASIDHVGIYLGGGRMINAAKPGTRVRIEQVRTTGYSGGARPW